MHILRDLQYQCYESRVHCVVFEPAVPLTNRTDLRSSLKYCFHDKTCKSISANWEGLSG